MSEKYTERDVNRRSFLKAVALTAAAAAATGSAAGLLLKGKSQQVVSVPPTPKVENITPMTNPDLASLQAQLTASQAENTRLQIRLSAAQSQLELVNRSTPVQESVDPQAWQAQLEEAHTQTASLLEENSLLRGLIELYEQFDVIDLAAVTGTGIAAVDGALEDLVGELPGLDEGIEAGHRALEELEVQIPAVRDGRQWLDGQIRLLTDSFQRIEGSLAKAVNSAGSFFQQFNDWAGDILKWLPFGIGDKAADILEALAQLLTNVPATVDGMQEMVAAPLDVWLADDGGEPRLQRRIVKPMRENVLDKANTTLNKVDSMQQIYQNQLAAPVSSAVENQQKIRALIMEYRQTYQV